MKLSLPVGLIVLWWLISAQSAVAGNEAGYRVIEVAPHDPLLFTQGFELDDNIAYESSGLYAESKVRKYQLETNQSLAQVRLPPRYFAEGLTLLKDTLYLLTWKENTVLLLDPGDLSTRGQISYDGEGWGLANNGIHLIMSDGSDTISFRNPVTFKVEHQIKVKFGQQPISRINELEFAEGYIWANVWFSPVILKINPATGDVAAIYNLEKLAKEHTNGRDQRVLNGIAYDKRAKAFWVTGKYWSARYLVEFSK